MPVGLIERTVSIQPKILYPCGSTYNKYEQIWFQNATKGRKLLFGSLKRPPDRDGTPAWTLVGDR